MPNGSANCQNIFICLSVLALLNPKRSQQQLSAKRTGMRLGTVEIRTPQETDLPDYRIQSDQNTSGVFSARIRSTRVICPPVVFMNLSSLPLELPRALEGRDITPPRAVTLEELEPRGLA